MRPVRSSSRSRSPSSCRLPRGGRRRRRAAAESRLLLSGRVPALDAAAPVPRADRACARRRGRHTRARVRRPLAASLCSARAGGGSASASSCRFFDREQVVATCEQAAMMRASASRRTICAASASARAPIRSSSLAERLSLERFAPSTTASGSLALLVEGCALRARRVARVTRGASSRASSRARGDAAALARTRPRSRLERRESPCAACELRVERVEVEHRAVRPRAESLRSAAQRGACALCRLGSAAPLAAPTAAEREHRRATAEQQRRAIFAARARARRPYHSASPCGSCGSRYQARS